MTIPALLGSNFRFVVDLLTAAVQPVNSRFHLSQSDPAQTGGSTASAPVTTVVLAFTLDALISRCLHDPGRPTKK
jgi:hypothetical protein